MSKSKLTVSINENLVGSVNSVSSRKGIPISEIVGKYITFGLKQEIELTAAERYHFQRQSLNSGLDNVLRLFSIKMEDAGLTDKFQTCLSLSQGFLRLKKREYRYAVIEQSVFELLNNVKDMDLNLFDIWLTDMSVFGKMKQRYLLLYPKTRK